MDLKRITAPEAKKLIDEEGYRLLDVRSTPEFGDEHPAGAYNVPFLHKTSQGMVPNTEFSKVIRSLFPDPEAKIITSCQMGGRSVRAATELKNLGYKNVIDLRGGFGSERDDSGEVVQKGWRDSGLPTEKGDHPERGYAPLLAKAAPPAPVEKAAEPVGHDHGHDHGHGHSHGPGTTNPEAIEGANRFASEKRRVMCAKLGQELPGLKRRPYPGPTGERIFNHISAVAWNEWVEHSKMVINEYRINSADPHAMRVLMERCEEFLFGAGSVAVPEGYIPESQRGQVPPSDPK